MTATPRIVFQSAYDETGTPTQYWDGYQMQPQRRENKKQDLLFVTPSNVLQESQLFFTDGVRFNNISTEAIDGKARLLDQALPMPLDTASPGLTSLSSSSSSLSPLVHYLVYEASPTANELSLGYYAIPAGHTVNNIGDVGTIIIVAPRTSILPKGACFPLIGSTTTGFSTTFVSLSLSSSEAIASIVVEEIASIGSYQFANGSRLGFVLFAGCWKNDGTGFTPDWRRAVWTEPQLNSDRGVVLPGQTEQERAFNGHHFATYTRASELVAPIKSYVQVITAEDTPLHWNSDCDFYDLVMYVMRGSTTLLPPTNNSNTSSTADLPISPLSDFCGDVAITAPLSSSTAVMSRLLAFGVPEASAQTGSVVLFAVSEAASLTTLHSQIQTAGAATPPLSTTSATTTNKMERGTPSATIAPPPSSTSAKHLDEMHDDVETKRKQKNATVLVVSSDSNGDYGEDDLPTNVVDAYTGKVFGSSVVMAPDASWLIVGAPRTTYNGWSEAGAIYLYGSPTLYVSTAFLPPPPPPPVVIYGNGNGTRLGRRMVIDMAGATLACTLDSGNNTTTTTTTTTTNTVSPVSCVCIFRRPATPSSSLSQQWQLTPTTSLNRPISAPAVASASASASTSTFLCNQTWHRTSMAMSADGTTILVGDCSANQTWFYVNAAATTYQDQWIGPVSLSSLLNTSTLTPTYPNALVSCGRSVALDSTGSTFAVSFDVMSYGEESNSNNNDNNSADNNKRPLAGIAILKRAISTTTICTLQAVLYHYANGSDDNSSGTSILASALMMSSDGYTLVSSRRVRFLHGGNTWAWQCYYVWKNTAPNTAGEAEWTLVHTCPPYGFECESTLQVCSPKFALSDRCFVSRVIPSRGGVCAF